MKKEKSILKNYVFNLIKTVSTIIFPVITFTYLARTLGVESVGKVNFAKAVISYFVMIAMLGMNFYGTREVAKVRDDKQKLSICVHELLLINSITMVAAYLLLFIGMWKIPKLHGYETLLFINSFSILLQSMGMEWLYQGIEEYRYIAVRSIIFQMFALIAMFIFVKSSQDVISYAVIYIVATSGSYVLNFFNARKYINFKWYGHYKIRRHLKPLLWLFAMAVSIELYTVLDSTMLGFIQGDVAVGKYTAAIKVNKLINTLITSFGVVLIPRLSYYISSGQIEKVKVLIDRTYNFVFLLSVPASIGLFALSNEIILLFSGEQFISASFTMKLLTPIVLVIPFSVVTNNQTFVPMGKEKLILISTCAGAITNFVCNMILIPKYAENGAAIATVLAEAVVAFICFLNVKHYFNMRSILHKYYQYWIAALPIVLITWLVDKLSIHYVIKIGCVIATSVLCYFVILLLFGNLYVKEALSIVQNKVIRFDR